MTYMTQEEFLYKREEKLIEEARSSIGMLAEVAAKARLLVNKINQKQTKKIYSAIHGAGVECPNTEATSGPKPKAAAVLLLVDALDSLAIQSKKLIKLIIYTCQFIINFIYTTGVSIIIII